MSCPICQKATVPQYRPFCSKRCADVDLGRWLNQGYTIPVVDESPAEDEVPVRSQDDGQE
ncbi:MAG: DNA gyrase inhibitor YacG [Pseudomonadota bacterium]